MAMCTKYRITVQKLILIEFEYMEYEPTYDTINSQPLFNMLVWGSLKLDPTKLSSLNAWAM